MPALSRKQRSRNVRGGLSSRNGTKRRLSALFRARADAGNRGSRHILPRDVVRRRSAAEDQRADAQYQAAVKNFDAAIRQFRRQSYAKAKELFEKLIDSPVREVAERARVHVRLCEQKLAPAVRPPKTNLDYYTLGIAELNSRRLELAIEYLGKAEKTAPNGDHIHYALAAARALQGNADTALGHLKTAIARRPQNRFQARHDEDFQSLASDPRFKQLVYSEASRSSQTSS